MVVDDLAIGLDDGVVHPRRSTDPVDPHGVPASRRAGRRGRRIRSREELLDRVWGYGYFGDSRIVDVHIRRLRHRIEPRPRQPEVCRDGARAGLSAGDLSARPALAGDGGLRPAVPGRVGRAVPAHLDGRVQPTSSASANRWRSRKESWGVRSSRRGSSSRAGLVTAPLDGLPTTQSTASLCLVGGQWYSTSPRVGAAEPADRPRRRRDERPGVDPTGRGRRPARPRGRDAALARPRPASSRCSR